MFSTISSRPRKLLSGLFIQAAHQGIAVRQLVELQKQTPSLYALLSINACALAYTHYPFAPTWLTVWLPGALVGICAVRAANWWRMRLQDVTELQAIGRLRLTTVLTVLISVLAAAWALALEGYGGPYEQGHVAFFMAVTGVACILCLTHLPAAAFILAAIISGSFTFYCLIGENRVFIAIALNCAFVMVVMIRTLTTNFLAFVELVASQSRAERLAEENAQLAHTDSLTGLPNRRFFFLHLDASIDASAKDGSAFALIIFDLDRFKPINDTYGHNTGDRVLAEIGARLAAFASADVIITRLGGDEFGLLIRSPRSEETVMAFCNGVCEALQAPIAFGEAKIVVGCSGGLALYPSAGRTGDALFDRADYALYHSKERRRGLTTLFSQEHEDAIRAERAVETALGSADLAAEMEIHYQPILDTHTNGIAMVEGLARWTSPTLGRVPPDKFIAAAERCGIIHSLTVLLLRKALVDATRLPSNIGLTFNLSAHDLVSPETVLSILATVRESGFDPRRLTLELTESALMQDFEGAKASIGALRALGMKVALDDFGTGFSSLGYVHRLPLDKIKIDRSFIADIGSDLGRSVVVTILDLCHNLGLKSIAEGIESPDQLEAVRRHGCHYVQGYLIGRPMPIGKFLDELRHATPVQAADTLCFPQAVA